MPEVRARTGDFPLSLRWLSLDRSLLLPRLATLLPLLDLTLLEWVVLDKFFFKLVHIYILSFQSLNLFL